MSTDDPAAALHNARGRSAIASLSGSRRSRPRVASAFASLASSDRASPERALPSLVSAVSIGHALRPKRYMQVELLILCSDGLVRRDGVPMRIGRRQIQSEVEKAVDNPGAVLCVLPDESVQELSFTDYAISQSFDEIGRQWRGSLTVKAVQWDTVVTEV